MFVATNAFAKKLYSSSLQDEECAGVSYVVSPLFDELSKTLVDGDPRMILGDKPDGIRILGPRAMMQLPRWDLLCLMLSLAPCGIGDNGGLLGVMVGCCGVMSS